MQQLTDRVAVVTGAGSGIGREVARKLAERGCHVAVVDVRAEGLEQTADLVRARGVRASTHVADVRDADRMTALAGEVEAEHGGCHVLVNNAGVTSAGAFEDEPLEDLHWIVDVNVWGVVHGCQAFLPLLRRQEEAHVVNVSSMVGLVGLPHNAAYALTKGAVRSFSEALRAELVTTGVRVTTVFPGAHRTGITQTARGSQGARIAALGRSRYAALGMRSPAGAARRIVRGIERDRARIVVGPDARTLDLLARVAPGRTDTLGRLTSRAAARSR